MPNLILLLQKLLSHQALSESEAKEAMEMILANVNSEQASAFLALLSYRGAKAHEVVAIFELIQAYSLSVQIPYATLDIVGTGGDMAGTVNISTGSALLAAACGIPIVKHGNRAVSSQCGSADVLERLGVNIEMPPEAAAASLAAANIAFLYAPFYNPLLKTVRALRRKMGIPTLFNLIGPLLNPVKPEYLLIGVAKKSDLELMSEVIVQLQKVKKAFIYHGNGLDELSTFGNTTGYLIAEGKKTKLEIQPQQFGFEPCDLKDLRGGDISTNAKLLLTSLSGKMNAITETLILNAGVALTLYGKSASFAEGFEFARQIVKQGKAAVCLEKLVQFTNHFKQERLYG